ILETLSSRGDVFADVDRAITRLLEGGGRSAQTLEDPDPAVAAPKVVAAQPFTPPARADNSTSENDIGETPSRPQSDPARRRGLRIALGATLFAISAALMVLAYLATKGRHDCPPGTYYGTDPSTRSLCFANSYSGGIPEQWVGVMNPGLSH